MIGRFCATAIASLRALVVLYLCAVCAGAGAYALLEHKAFLDALWWAFVTALTIGYGDLYPATPGGRLVAIALMHLVPLFILPLIIARLSARLIRNDDAFTHAEQEELKTLLREIRAAQGDVQATGDVHAPKQA